MPQGRIRARSTPRDVGLIRNVVVLTFDEIYLATRAGRPISISPQSHIHAGSIKVGGGACCKLQSHLAIALCFLWWPQPPSSRTFGFAPISSFVLSPHHVPRIVPRGAHILVQLCKSNEWPPSSPCMISKLDSLHLFFSYCSLLGKQVP